MELDIASKREVVTLINDQLAFQKKKMEKEARIEIKQVKKICKMEAVDFVKRSTD